jgi:hypothetical protein
MIVVLNRWQEVIVTGSAVFRRSSTPIIVDVILMLEPFLFDSLVHFMQDLVERIFDPEIRQ